MSSYDFSAECFSFSDEESFLTTKSTEIETEPEEDEPEFGSEEEAEQAFRRGEDEEEEEGWEDEEEVEWQGEKLSLKHLEEEGGVENFLRNKFLKALEEVNQKTMKPNYQLTDLMKKGTRKKPSLLQTIREIEDELGWEQRAVSDFKSAGDLNQYIEALDKAWLEKEGME